MWQANHEGPAVVFRRRSNGGNNVSPCLDIGRSGRQITRFRCRYLPTAPIGTAHQEDQTTFKFSESQWRRMPIIRRLLGSFVRGR